MKITVINNYSFLKRGGYITINERPHLINKNNRIDIDIDNKNVIKLEFKQGLIKKHIYLKNLEPNDIVEIGLKYNHFAWGTVVLIFYFVSYQFNEIDPFKGNFIFKLFIPIAFMLMTLVPNIRIFKNQVEN